MRKTLCFLITFSFTLSFSFCDPLQVGADSSLRGVLQELSQKYADEFGDTAFIELSIAPSGSLRKKIEAGSPLDIFIAAAPGEIEELSRQNLLIPESVRALAENKMAIVTAWSLRPEEKNRSWQSLARLDWERISVANYETSMSGVAAKAIFEAEDLAEDLTGKLFYENDPEKVVERVKRGKVNAGVIYQSDVRLLQPRETYHVFEISSTNYPPIIYSAVVLKRSKRIPDAAQFINFLASTNQHEVWAAWGFSPSEYFSSFGSDPFPGLDEQP